MIKPFVVKCDGCGRDVGATETITNVGDSMEVIILCDNCQKPKKD